jgi:hypothetical protein
MLSAVCDFSLTGGGASLTQYIQRTCNKEITGIMSDIFTVTYAIQVVYLEHQASRHMKDRHTYTSSDVRKIFFNGT